MLPFGSTPYPIRKPCRRWPWSVVLAVLVSCIAGAGRARAQSLSAEGFEGAEPSWRFAEADAAYRVEVHQRSRQAAHTGAGGELVRIQSGTGRFVYLAHEITPVHIIDELRPSVWVRANKPGIQFLARIVFPHIADPRTGKPITRLVAGSTYSQQGSWQQLRIDQLPKLVQAVVRPMRSQLGSHIDTREPYVDRLLLNLYAGPGSTSVSIDDLELPKAVAVGAPADGHAGSKAPAPLSDRPPRPRVQLSGSVLLIDDHPFFPRMIEYQGESFAFLKGLGFNVIRLTSAATDAQLDEARRAEVWLVCPPPPLKQEDETGSTATTFHDRYDPVLAWHFGQGLSSRNLEAMRQWVEQVRRADETVARPLICDPSDDLAQYCRAINFGGILMVHRYLLGTTFELADFGTWLRTRPRLGLAGMPVWATIETQHSRELSEQIALLSAGQAPEPTVSLEQVQLMTQAALAAGVRGLCFASRSPLDAQDSATRSRAMILSLINIQLHAVRSWIAVGTVTPQVRAANSGGENPGITGGVLQAGHARLLLPLWAGTGAQYVADQLSGNKITFVVPGAPEDNTAYEITEGGLQSLDRKRSVGGVHVIDNEFGPTSLILLTNGIAVAAMNQGLPNAAPKAAQLERELASYRLAKVQEIDRQLARVADRVLDAPRLFEQARHELAEADKNYAQRDWMSTCVSIRRAMRPLRLIERGHWEKAIASLGSPAVSPLVATFEELPYHWLLARELESLGRSRSVLPQGDLENLRTVWNAGWRLYKHAQPGVQTMGEITKEKHQSGEACLHLAVKAVDPEVRPTMLESPALWVSTPPIQAVAGQWYRIHGWAQVPKAIEASLDGLLILDSLGREPLAERIGKTEGWREFTMYRAAPASGPWQVTIAMTGLGEAWIDGVTVELLRSPPRNQPRLSRGQRTYPAAQRD